MSSLDEKIELSKQHKLGGCLRNAVLNRLNDAVDNQELYTKEQFEYWMECLNYAAEIADDPEVESGIYRDLGLLWESFDDDKRALHYYNLSISVYPETRWLPYLNERIKELTK